MRLAYLVSGFPTLSETFVVREILEIRRLGHEVQVYSLKSNPDAGYDAAAEGIARETEYSPFFLSARLLWANLKTAISRPLPYWGTLLYVLAHSLGRPWECAKALFAYPKTIYYGALMASRGVQHIHAHFANVPTLSALIISRIWGIPYSFTAHAHDLFQFRSMLAEKLKGARFAVPISEYNRSFLGRYCAEDDLSKTFVVHCGADVGRLARFPHRPQPRRIVSVARLSEMKGLVYLVEACGLLRDRGVHVECIVWGEGPERPALEAKIRERNLEETVSLPGRVPADQVPSMVAEASVFVLPCVRARDGAMDGIPVSLMEAMALKVPVVSTRISGIPELVRDGETGLVVPPEDPVALADAIERLLNEPALAERLAENGRRFVFEHYDLRKSARALVELFEQYSR